jgi:hypothetical protein
MKRPELADRLRFSAELRLLDGYPSVRLRFTDAGIEIEDAPPEEPPSARPGNFWFFDLAPEAAEIVNPPFDSTPDAGPQLGRFAPDVMVEGTLAEIVAVMAVPTYGGLPNLAHPHARSTLATIAAGRLRFRGNLLRAGQLVRLLQI